MVLGIDRLRNLTAAVPIPVFALGGITPENALSLLGTGIAGIAAVGAFEQ
jgi:thiamine monophosphate synthase